MYSSDNVSFRLGEARCAIRPAPAALRTSPETPRWSFPTRRGGPTAWSSLLAPCSPSLSVSIPRPCSATRRTRQRAESAFAAGATCLAPLRDPAAVAMRGAGCHSACRRVAVRRFRQDLAPHRQRALSASEPPGLSPKPRHVVCHWILNLLTQAGVGSIARCLPVSVQARRPSYLWRVGVPCANASPHRVIVESA